MSRPGLWRLVLAAVAAGAVGGLVGHALAPGEAHAGFIHPRVQDYVTAQSILEGGCSTSQPCSARYLQTNTNSAGTAQRYAVYFGSTSAGLELREATGYWILSGGSAINGNQAIDWNNEITISTNHGFYSARASGANAYGVGTNGARYDLGTGSNDYLSSDGTYGGSGSGWRVNRGNVAKPACAAGTRGLLWYIEGGAGVADTYEACVKDAADNYAWTSVY
jgi:hypothetical protein